MIFSQIFHLFSDFFEKINISENNIRGVNLSQVLQCYRTCQVYAVVVNEAIVRNLSKPKFPNTK